MDGELQVLSEIYENDLDTGNVGADKAIKCCQSVWATKKAPKGLLRVLLVLGSGRTRASEDAERVADAKRIAFAGLITHVTGIEVSIH